MSSRVPGPNASSQRRTSSARASSTGSSADAVWQPALDRAPAKLPADPGAHAAAPRPMRPSSARWKNTFEATLIEALVGLPRATCVIRRSSRGSTSFSSAVAASPRSRMAARPPPRARPAGGRVGPDAGLASACPASACAPSRAMASEAAAWIIGTSTSGTRKSVRRMASRRSTVGSSYMLAFDGFGRRIDHPGARLEKDARGIGWHAGPRPRRRPRRGRRPACPRPADAGLPTRARRSSSVMRIASA